MDLLRRQSIRSFPRSSRWSLVGGSFALLLSGFLVVPLACDDSGGSSNATAPVSIGVSDAPVEGLAKVVITIDRIVLNRPGADLVVDRFTNEDLDIFDEDTITVDLLDYRGEDNMLIVGPIDMRVGDYQNLRLEIIDNDISRSYVQELGGAIRPIEVPSGELKLGRFAIEDRGDQTFILEFGLRHALTYNPGPDRYILKPRGVRIVEVSRGATIGGIVDPDLFDSEAPCDLKPDAFAGNVVYLYRGTALDPADLADAFDPELDLVAAADYLEPFASETVADDGSYFFAYVPAGPYTLAFSCDAVDDDPEYDDGIFVPAPEDALVEVSTDPNQSWICDFPVPIGGCALDEPLAP